VTTKSSISTTTGAHEFEAKIQIPGNSQYCPSLPSHSTASNAFSRIAAQSGGGGIPSQFLTQATAGTGAGSSSNPVLEDVSALIPLPPQARSILNTKVSKGDYLHDTQRNYIQWRIPNNAVVPGASYSFKFEVVVKSSSGYGEDDEDEDAEETTGAGGNKLSNFDNNYEPTPYSSTSASNKIPSSATTKDKERKSTTPSSQATPRNILLNFTIRGALLSGLRVDSLTIVGGKGLSENVKPYKGVKYITRAGDGSVEFRC